MNAIGMDIGTTTICAIVVDTQTGAVQKTVTTPNDCPIISTKRYERLQNPEKILEKVRGLVETLVKDYAPIACIGVTGQMHGVVYLDETGKALSPFYTWQDESALEPYTDEKTYAAYLASLTEYPMSAGFGLATVFVHTINKTVPENAANICTIHDYVAMHLAGEKLPIMHASNAASFGLFDSNTRRFDISAIQKAGIRPTLLPKIGTDRTVLGFFHNIPVCIAIGDNQASYIGTVRDREHSVLVNIGTGSQVSFSLGKEPVDLPESLECRPCTDECSIAVGSALCGGRAFAALEKFFREVTETVTDAPCGNAYAGIDTLLASLDSFDTTLGMSTLFCGSRNAPDKRGSVTNLSLENFSPRDFVLATLHGIAGELYDMYRCAMEKNQAEHKVLVGSGNGLRKNKALQKVLETTFGMPLSIPAHQEEAAYGAVLYAMNASGVCESITEAGQRIKYQ